jgi:N6-adenosine-specific RNA methylase IME4
MASPKKKTKAASLELDAGTLRGNTFGELFDQFADAFAEHARTKVGTTADVGRLVERVRARNVELGRDPGAGADVIMADPPWRYKQMGTVSKAGKESRPAGVAPYDTMDVSQLCAMDVKALAGTGSCVLLMWATSVTLLEARAVMRAWGFQYCTVFLVWVKMLKTGKPVFGVGHHTRSNAEFMLIGRRGPIVQLYDHEARCSTSQILETKTGKPKHSEKPQEARRLVEKLFPNTVRAELFTRHANKGWEGFGNQAGALGGSVTQPTLKEAWAVRKKTEDVIYNES